MKSSMDGGWGFFESKKKKKYDEQIKNFDKKFNGTPPRSSRKL